MLGFEFIPRRMALFEMLTGWGDELGALDGKGRNDVEETRTWICDEEAMGR